MLFEKGLWEWYDCQVTSRIIFEIIHRRFDSIQASDTNALWQWWNPHTSILTCFRYKRNYPTFVFTTRKQIWASVSATWVHRPYSVVCHVADEADGLQVRRLAANVLNKQSETRGDPPAWVLSEGITSSCFIKLALWEMLHSVIRAIKSREMRRAASIERVGGGGFVRKTFMDETGDLGVMGR